MGIYVNPAKKDKEAWLQVNGEEVSEQTAVEWVKDGTIDFTTKMPVVLVDNGPFTAAGVAYDPGEFEVFTAEDDLRPKKYFVVAVEELKKVSDLDLVLGD